MSQISWLAVVVCALSAFVLGGLWYGPLFKHAWCREAGIDPDAAERIRAHTFATAFVAAFIAATAFDWLMGPAPGLRVAVHRRLPRRACAGGDELRASTTPSPNAASSCG